MNSGNEYGYTFIEVLVALAILSLSGFLLWTGLAMGIEAVEKLHIRNSESSEVALFEFLFRKQTGDLGPAFWEKENGDEIDWIYERDDKLFLDSGEGVAVFTRLKLLDIEKTDIGIEASLETTSGRELVIKALYGSFALSGETDEED